MPIRMNLDPRNCVSDLCQPWARFGRMKKVLLAAQRERFSSQSLLLHLSLPVLHPARHLPPQALMPRQAFAAVPSLTQLQANTPQSASLGSPQDPPQISLVSTTLHRFHSRLHEVLLLFQTSWAKIRCALQRPVHQHPWLMQTSLQLRPAPSTSLQACKFQLTHALSNASSTLHLPGTSTRSLHGVLRCGSHPFMRQKRQLEEMVPHAHGCRKLRFHSTMEIDASAMCILLDSVHRHACLSCGFR